jgi:translocation and assembly module TamA
MRLLVLLLLFVNLFAEGNVSKPSEGSEDNTSKMSLPSKTVYVEGMEACTASEIYDAISADHPSFFQFWKEDNATIKNKLIPTISPALRNFYDSEGYYDAEFEIKEGKNDIHIAIEEGEPVRIADINISSDFDISELVEFKKGEVFKAKDFISLKGRIIEQLLKEGYCSYELDSKAYVDLEKHTVDIRFVLNKGGVCTFGNVTVTGLKTIDPQIVKSRVRAEKGSRFSTEAVQNTSAAIYGLQSFDSVLINVDRKFYNVVPVDIRVQEMEKPYHVEAGAGYDTYVGARVHGTFVKHNFLGNAQQLSLKASWSQLEQLAIIDFYKPLFANILDVDFDLGVSTGYSNLEFDGFRETKVFMKGFFKHESERLKFITGLTFEVIEISELDDDIPLLPDYAYDTFLLAYPYLDITYDARDSKLNPKYGYYLSAYTEYGIPTDTDSSLYLKTELEARGIYTFSNLTMAIVGKIGSIDIMDDSYRGIPESKKFFGGGAYSNRAYGYRELGVIVSPTEDLINGALSMANLSFEMDYPVWGDLYAAAFTDNTMLTDESYDFSGEIITSAGVGVRYMTPVGPFKLDVGFNVHEPSQYGISFQIGQSF